MVPLFSSIVKSSVQTTYILEGFDINHGNFLPDLVILRVIHFKIFSFLPCLSSVER